MDTSLFVASILKSIMPPAAVAGQCNHDVGDGQSRTRSSVADVVLAVHRRDPVALERLLREEGADPNRGMGTTTPLGLAITSGAFSCVEVLLRLGADPRRRSVDSCGRMEPPLVTAVRLGCTPALCALLLDHGADPDGKDFYGHSPLWVAVYGKQAELVEALLAAGATVRELGPEGQTITPPWNECPLYEGMRQGWRYCLPLVSAGASGDADLLRVTLDRGEVGIVKGLALASGIRLPPTECYSSGDDWLIREMSTPPPLSRLCRHTVRAALLRANGGRDLRPRAPLLPISPHLIRYVLLDPLGP